MNNNLLAVTEVANMFGVSVKSVHKWVDQNKLDYFKDSNGEVIIPSDQFEGKLLDREKVDKTHDKILGKESKFDYADKRHVIR